MSEKKVILVVEDDVAISDLYAHVLRNAGFEVLTALTGGSGIELIKEHAARLSLILLDIMLPEKNGIEVLQWAKGDERAKDVPVIILSNLAQDNVIDQAKKIGAIDYIIKMKIDPYALVEKVKQTTS
jgi:DNA-binding response OmpR family regulator